MNKEQLLLVQRALEYAVEHMHNSKDTKAKADYSVVMEALALVKEKQNDL